MGGRVGFMVDSGIYMGLVICITLLIFIFTMRAFDSKKRLGFIAATLGVAAALLVLSVIQTSNSLAVEVLSLVVPYFALGIMFLYMYMYAQRYNVDSVTKCFKRRCFYADAKKHEKSKMAIISMDLNDLKLINDNYGHKAGDVALLTFAEACRSVKPSKFILYRTGGDEFMMLGIRADEEEARKTIADVVDRLKNTPYSCSFGLHMYNPPEDFDAAVVKADKAMYAYKREFKKSKADEALLKKESEVKQAGFSNNISFLD